MTQEEKLEEAKRFYKTVNKDQRYVLEKLFPELKESEDEQVRKEIIEFLQDCNAIDSGYLKKYCKTTIEKMITWLEKQGKQKPADLEVFISELSKQFPDVSFAKLSRIAVRVAKWAKPTDEEMKELLHTEYEKGKADTIAEMQKPAWSEDDEMIALSIEQVINCASLLNIVPEKVDKIRTWLKSLKDRCTWKPSEEQLDALKRTQTGVIQFGVLQSLYNDLKKLSQS